MPDYALEGPHWLSPDLTWSVDATVAPDLVATIAAAFSDWAGVSSLHFQQVGASAAANIRIGESAIDGPNATLGVTNYAFSGSSFTFAHIAFDSGEGWHASGGTMVNAGGASLRVTAEHEIGHALGLDHYTGGPAVMNPMIDRAITGLTASDIHGIQALYGAPTASPVPVASAPAASSSPSSALATLTHGGFDAAYYLAHNPDVAAAVAGAGGGAADAAYAHYLAYGWREGRDPNALFSTKGYLAANPDVRAAGVNPLLHYDQDGWHEGRSPGPSFSAEAYLAANPDVRAAGIDPLAHYLAYGQAGGRAAFAGESVGSDGHVHYGDFDATYYLARNRDVAAAVPAGMDGNSSAFTHYLTWGWQEGRAASAAFDTHAYLMANPDVAAAHIDPLLHYMQYGAAEGRHLA